MHESSPLIRQIIFHSWYS